MTGCQVSVLCILSMGFTFELAGGVAAASMSLYLISFHGEFYMVKSIW